MFIGTLAYFYGVVQKTETSLTKILSQLTGFIALTNAMAMQCAAGHEGAVADISCMSIFSACFGLPTSVQLAATTCTCQIWISGWILPHFDVRTISVA